MSDFIINCKAVSSHSWIALRRLVSENSAVDDSSSSVARDVALPSANHSCRSEEAGSW